MTVGEGTQAIPSSFTILVNDLDSIAAEAERFAAYMEQVAVMDIEVVSKEGSSPSPWSTPPPLIPTPTMLRQRIIPSRQVERPLPYALAFTYDAPHHQCRRYPSPGRRMDLRAPIPHHLPMLR